MITRHLVHAYSDYGEGNFYVVKRVVKLGSQDWEIDVLIGIDSMPSGGVDEYKGTFRFTVASGLLSMKEVDAPEGVAQASDFFKCEKVLDGMYLKPGDTGSLLIHYCSRTLSDHWPPFFCKRKFIWA